MMIMVYAHPIVSFLRNFKRERKVPAAGVLGTWANVYNLLDEYKKIFGDRFILVHTPAGPEEEAEIGQELNEVWVDSKQIINKVVAMIKQAPKEDQERLANIAKIMYNYPWYWEMSDARNTEDKARGKDAMIKKFYNELENEESEKIAIDIYNAYAPGGPYRPVSEPHQSRTVTSL